MFVVVESQYKFVVCDYTGAFSWYAVEEQAQRYAEVISANNPGVYTVRHALSPGLSGYSRAVTDRHNKVRVRGIRLPAA